MGKKFQYEDSGEEDNEEDIGSEIDEEDDEYQSNSDLIEEESDDEDGSSAEHGRDGFGSKKSAYVKESDVTDSDDSGEEHAAEAIYREQQRVLNEDDFIDADFANDARDKDVAEDDDDEHEGEKDAGAAAEKAAEERDRKERLIKKLSPEIMSLAREMKVSMREINEKLLPLLEINEAKRILQQKGNNYLEIRYELLLAYTICILFYLILKAKGKVTNNHPVLDALTKYKTYFERMNVSLEGFYAQATQVLKKTLKSDKKSAAPKPLSFEQKMKQMAAQSQAKKSNKGTTQAAKDAKALQEELKNMQGFSSDEDEEDFDEDDDDMMSDEDEMSEDDEDIRITKGARAAAAAAAAAAPKSKKQQKKNDSDDEINMDSVEPWMLDDDDDMKVDDGDTILMAPKKVDLNKMKQVRENNEKKAKGKGGAAAANSAGGYEDEFYKMAKQNQENAVVSKKTQRIQEKQQKREVLQKKFEVAEIADEQSRKITPQIMHNKGTLIRKRKKIDGNAKLKNRMKYERKLKIHNRNHGGKIYEQKKQYYGEMGAIKSSLVKSSKL